MLLKISKYLSLSLLALCSCASYAASDSSTIGLNVTIKATQHCDYAYATELQPELSTYYSRSSACDISNSKLQLHLDQVEYINKEVNQSQTNVKKFRVVMTIQ